MREFLFQWIQDIAFYSLLMVVVLNVLPKQSQQKYLKFFMGIVLIILVISPVLTFTGLDQRLDETYVRQTYDQELQEFMRQQEAIEKEYERYVNEKLEEAGQEETGDMQEDEENSPEDSQEGEAIEIPEIYIKIDARGSEEEGDSEF